MHPKAQEALLDKIVAIADRATRDAARPGIEWRSWEEIGFPNTVIGPAEVAQFRRIVEGLASRPDWRDRFSERYIDERLAKVLVAAHRHDRDEAANQLTGLVRNLQDFATEQRVIVPIGGL